MKRLRENIGRTLARLLGECPHPSPAHAWSPESTVWERLLSEIVDAPVEIVSEPVAVRRYWRTRVGFVGGVAIVGGSVVTLLEAFVRSLLHGGSSADE